MNKKFFISTLIMFVAWMVGSFIVHGFLLGTDYESFPNLYRSEADSQGLMHFMLLGHVLLAGAFTWIYAKGKNSNAWPGQGTRYGIAIACLAVIPTYMIYYVVQPMSGSLAIKQSIFESGLVILLGILVAFLYKND
jgi:hypothetical protein